MNEKRKQLLGSFLLGVLLPLTVLQFASITKPVVGVQTEPTATAGTQLPTTEAPAQTEERWYIPVMIGSTVVTVELETYLTGVLLGEMPAYFEEEALMAQAVVARTYALYHHIRGYKHPGGAVCTDPGCCQAYVAEAVYVERGGREADVQKLRNAVEATAGVVLTYEGELIDATYFSCSGGKTESALAVWGAEVPYLQSVSSPGEESAEHYSDTVWFEGADFQRLLGRSLSGSPGSWLGKVEYTVGGGVATMIVGGRTYTGTELRALLGLNSTAFDMRAEGSGISVTTRGKGHRVGLSQEGAEAMAAVGCTWEEIVSRYYVGTRIDKLTDIG